jgi:protein-disulfide isomerase
MNSVAVSSTYLTLPDPHRDHVHGSSYAPIRLLEYGDFECPYCAQAAQSVRALEGELGAQLSFAFRNFPLTKHPHAFIAATAAEVAGAQDQFWQMHDVLFQNQDALEYEDLLRYAEGLGLNLERFMQDLTHGVYRHRVEEDLRAGERADINGTPTFFLNGEAYEGEMDAASLAQMIERRR